MKSSIYFTFLLSLLMTNCKSPSGPSSKSVPSEATNHLAQESSPYLLQHARNPVDWYPWGPEALAKAKAENKMLIISIGYAACHWCHVMEHESFEDTTVAKIMNEHFVAIKVDREERPDVDDVYMTACHLANGGSCGWPLNAFALPDERPVWAGTYFPKKKWIEILEYFVKIREKEGDKLNEYADQLTAGIQQSELLSPFSGTPQFQSEEIDDYAKKLVKTMDLKKGGRVGAPKFPMPNTLQFLLHQYHRSKNATTFKAVKVSLDEMAKGGIYDHLGGGFARYSTDADWKVPHFEKMLYDNGQLVSLYANAYALTQDQEYRRVIEETLDFIQREMTSKEGGFYSSLDADSEGEEGKFYVWSQEELSKVLPDPQMRAVFYDYYSIKKGGNWEHDKNILYRRTPLNKVARSNNLSEAATLALIQEAKKLLMAERDTRIRPGLDDKILTSWNALMLKGYINAYRAVGHEKYLEIALRNAAFLQKKMHQSDHRLWRNYKDGKAVINAFLDDYALVIDAYLELYQVTFDPQWLKESDALCSYVMTHFYDPTTGFFFYTSDLDEQLITRKKEIADNVISSSNSVMASNLFRLGTLLYQQDYVDKASHMMATINQNLQEGDQPGFYANWCSLYLSLAKAPYEVVIMGEQYQDIQKTLLRSYLPDALFLGGNEEGDLPLLQRKKVDGETMIYVCQNKTCKLPVKTAEAALQQLQ